MREHTLATLRQKLSQLPDLAQWGELVRFFHHLPNVEKSTAQSYLRKHLKDLELAHPTRAQIFEHVLSRNPKDFFYSIWREKSLPEEIALYQDALALCDWVSFPEVRPKTNDYGSFNHGPIPLPSTFFWQNFRPYCGDVSLSTYSPQQDLFLYVDIGATGGQTYTSDIVVWNPLGPANFIQGGIWDFEGREVFFSPCRQFISIQGIDFQRKPRNFVLSSFGQRLFEWRPSQSKIRRYDFQTPHRYVQLTPETSRFYDVWERLSTPPKRLLQLDPERWLVLRQDNSLWEIQFTPQGKLTEKGPLHPDLPIVDIAILSQGRYALCCTSIVVPKGPPSPPSPFDDPNFDDPDFDWEAYLDHLEAIESQPPPPPPDYELPTIYIFPDEKSITCPDYPHVPPTALPIEHYGPKAAPCFVDRFVLLRQSETAPMFLWNPWEEGLF
ncbi:MAG: hypothetical protein H6727_16300 [Myxococcales bacterium]|nr:hypothetical protein [Myxococcales bacterium]